MPLLSEFFSSERCSASDVVERATQFGKKADLKPSLSHQQLIARFPNSHLQRAFLSFIPGYGLEMFFGVTTPNAVEEESFDTDLSYRISVKLNVSHFPCFVVDYLLINPCGNLAALVGSRGILVVALPKYVYSQLPEEDLRSEYLCKSDGVDERLFAESSLRCLKVRWHPCSSVQENFLVILLSDSTLRIYDAAECMDPVMKISLCTDSRPEGDSMSNRARMGFPDAPVGFDFGDPEKAASSDFDLLWPIFILHETGDVYSVLTDMRNLQHLGVDGPLTVYPPAEVDYGIDSCDILCLSGPVPVVVIATAYGIIYNSVLLQDRDFAAEELDPAKKYCLYVYESLELELSLSVLDLQTGEQTEENYSSFIQLCKGVHSVNLIWVHDLASMGSGKMKETSADIPASVDYVICTRPKGGLDSGGIRGFSVFPGSSSHASFALLLLHSWAVMAAPLKWLRDVKFFGKNSAADMDTTVTQIKEHESVYFVDEIKRILQRTSTVPILKSQKQKHVSEKEAGELLIRSIEILDREYVKKLEAARNFFDAKVHNLTVQKKNVVGELKEASVRVAAVGNQLSFAEERWELLSEEQRKIGARLSNLHSALHRFSGTASTADEQLTEKLLMLESACHALTGRLDAVRRVVSVEKRDSTAKSSGTTPRDSQLQALRSALSEQNDELESLIGSMRKINAQLPDRKS